MYSPRACQSCGGEYYGCRRCSSGTLCPRWILGGGSRHKARRQLLQMAASCMFQIQSQIQSQMLQHQGAQQSAYQRKPRKRGRASQQEAMMAPVKKEPKILKVAAQNTTTADVPVPEDSDECQLVEPASQSTCEETETEPAVAQVVLKWKVLLLKIKLKGRLKWSAKHLRVAARQQQEAFQLVRVSALRELADNITAS